MQTRRWRAARGRRGSLSRIQRPFELDLFGGCAVSGYDDKMLRLILARLERGETDDEQDFEFSIPANDRVPIPVRDPGEMNVAV
jgi:hypothetical protein